MPDRDLTGAKLESLRRCLDRIVSRTPDDPEALCSNYDTQDIIALNLQRAVQLCVDIGSRIIGEYGWNAPETMAGVFPVLARHGVITTDLADRLQRAVGFRNISVHEYREVDWYRVYRIITEDLKDFREFGRAVLTASRAGDQAK